MAIDTHPAPQQAQPLTDLRAGDSAIVFRINEGDHAQMIRLKTMGIYEGRAIRMVRPGSRVIIDCGGTRIGLAATVACHIKVTAAPLT